MPAPPEIGDGASCIWQAEVFGIFEAEHPAHADGHIAVAGEVKVDLKHEHQNAEPHPERGLRGKRAVKDLGRGAARVIGEQDLLAETDAEAVQAIENALGIHAAIRQLRLHIAVADDGARDELREQRDIQQKPRERALHADRAALYIHNIRKDLEGIERNADGQRDLGHGQREREQRVEVLHQKARVFEHDEAAEVKHDRERAPEGFVPALHQQAEGPVDERRGDHQKDIHRLAPGVEQQTRDEQQDVFGADAREDEI